MVKFEISQSKEELTSRSGLALVGAALRRMPFCERIDDVRLSGAKAEPAIPHGDVLKSYIRMLCQGKSDYGAIEPFGAGDEFFPLACDIEVLPSLEALRQSLDQLGALREDISTRLKQQNLSQLVEVVEECICYYNTERRHSSLGYVSPLTYIEPTGAERDRQCGEGPQ